MIAEVVQTLGIEMNAEKVANEYNERGYWEDYEMCKASEAILSKAGGDFWNLPTLPQINKVEHDISSLVDERNTRSGQWGWKDPRLCLTLFKFIPFLSMPRVIQIQRAEDSVVQSLLNYPPSDLHSVTHAQLFVRYLSLCLHLQTRGLESITLQYEKVLQNPTEVVGQIAKFLGIETNEKAIQCIEVRLNHHKFQP